MNLVVIYETAFTTVDAVLEYLRQKGYSAVVLEDPLSHLRRASDASHHTIRDFISPLAYVAVPPEQAGEAREALSGFRLPSSRRFAAACETLLFQVLIASLVTLAVAIVLIIQNPFAVFFPILYAVWVGTFVFVVYLSRIDTVLNRRRSFQRWQSPPA